MVDEILKTRYAAALSGRCAGMACCSQAPRMVNAINPLRIATALGRGLGSSAWARTHTGLG